MSIVETDLYLRYRGGDEVSWSVGYTGYYYTDDFDDTYNEINLGLGYGILAVDLAVGRWEGFGTPLDYRFASINVSPNAGPYYKLGGFGDEFGGEYFELGYGFDFETARLSLALTYSDSLNVSDPDDSEQGDYALVFGFRKALALKAP